MAIKNMIWSNDLDQFDDAEIRESIIERDSSAGEPTEDEIVREKCNLVSIYFDDEKVNLNKPLQGRILCIADLGLWNGRKSGYRIMDANLNAVLKAFQGDFCKVYSDGRNIVAKDTHHDGTNYYTFREIREEKNIDNLLAKIYAGTATSRDISTYTRSLVPYVANVYGWKCNYERYPYAKRAAA